MIEMIEIPPEIEKLIVNFCQELQITQSNISYNQINNESDSLKIFIEYTKNYCASDIKNLNLKYPYIILKLSSFNMNWEYDLENNGKIINFPYGIPELIKYLSEIN